MPITVDQLGRAIVAAGLMPADELKSLWSSITTGERPKDGETFAELLVKRGKLTEFQTWELLSGSCTPLVLGDYVLLSKIGAGGMGQVFKAQHRHMDRLVAIKLLPKDLIKDEDAIKRFQREVKAAAKLSHPNIVQAHDASVQKGVWYLVMEYVEGQDLAGVVGKNGPLPLAQAVDYIRQAAKGLAFAHSKGVVHRDIKPANLLLDGEGTVKILDMGLARIDDAATHAAQQGLTQSGQVMGTVDYMAPEQAFDTRHADARADIYSLGCTLYRLLTGRNLFDGESMVEKLMAHQTEPIPQLKALRPDAPAALVHIFEKMVAKQPGDRYQSMADVESALAAVFSSPSPSPSSSADSNLLSFFQSMTKRGGAAPQVVAAPASQPEGRPGDTSPTVSLAQSQLTTDPVSDRSIQVARENTPRPMGAKRPPIWKRPMVFAAGGLGGLLLLLVAIVFFVPTNAGTIRVEINDPSIEVAIQGTEILLEQADQGKDVRLAPGDKTLIVQRGDFKFETNKLVLKKGATVTVHVKLLAGKVEVKQGNTVLGQAKLPLPPIAKAPFDAAQAKAHQTTWAKHLGVEPVQPNSIGIKMALLPPGEFLMGSSDEDVALALKIAEETKLHSGGVQSIQDERPQHLVRITKPFCLGIHEVTIGQFGKFIEQSGYKTQAEEFGGTSDATKADDPRVTPERKKLNWRTPGHEVGENSPVTQVSWNDAAAFCNWLSEQEKLTPSYVRDGASWELVAQPQGYRLPTEAEWEYACRAGTISQFWFGDDWKEHDKFGWSNGNAGGWPRSVGLLPANPFGLYDMHGNVWEWCHDWYDGKWYEKSPSDDPTGPLAPSPRVFRGGSWFVTPASCRSSFRHSGHAPAARSGDRGFRIALGSVRAPSSTASAPPPGDYALSFAENTSVEIPSLKFDPAGPLTIEGYITPRELPELARHLIGVDKQFGLSINQGGHWAISIAATKDKKGVPVSTMTPVAVHRRTHVAGVWSGRTLQLYVDGKRVGAAPPENRSLPDPTKLFTLGGKFVGDIDEVRVSRTSRYGKDFAPQPRFESDADTLALYHFDEGTGDVLKDSSGNNHHGKIVDAQWVRADGGSATSDDPDRRAAEWVLNAGGNVGVREVSQTKISDKITIASKLPSGRFKVQMIGLGHKGKQVTEAGLENLAGLTEITDIDLNYCPSVSDRTLKRIGTYQALKTLFLSHTAVTDMGMEDLRTLINLTRLDLRDTQVTAAEVAKLQQALPKCKIDWNGVKSDAGMPFVTLRSGAAAARHATLEEALAASRPLDVIEIHGNGPFPIGGPKSVVVQQKEFTLKAAVGFRPLFLPAPSAADKTLSLFHFNDCISQFEDIDIVSAGPTLFQFNNSRDAAFLRCRCANTSDGQSKLFGFSSATEQKLSFSDCCLLAPYTTSPPLTFLTGPAKIEMTNTLLLSRYPALSFDASGNALRMNGCTIVAQAVTFWSLDKNQPERHASGTVEPSRCLILGPALTLHDPKLELHKDVRWQGKDNVYGLTSSGLSGVTLPNNVNLPFDEWVKSPAKPETGSKLVPTKPKPLAEFLDPDPAVMFAKLKTYLTELRTLHPDVGADPSVADSVVTPLATNATTPAKAPFDAK